MTPSRASAMPSGADRRLHPRANADWPIHLSLAEGPCEGKLRDLSKGGCCFFLDRPIPLMTVLRVRLELPVQDGVRRIMGTGAVVRCEKISARIDHYEIAVFLQEVAEPDREALEEFVRAGVPGRAD